MKTCRFREGIVNVTPYVKEAMSNVKLCHGSVFTDMTFILSNVG
jgi:hypothetical protein